MDLDSFNHLAHAIMTEAGLSPGHGPFTAHVAWDAHRRANARAAATTVLKKLLDIEERCGPGSPEEAIVQSIINCGPVPLEDYPLPAAEWEILGFELYRNGNGSHGAHIPMAVRQGGRPETV